MVVGEHETRVQVELLVFLIMGEEAAGVALVRTLHIIQRAVVEALVVCTDIGNKRSAAGFARAIDEPIVRRTAVAVAEEVVVERDEAVEVRRTGAGEMIAPVGQRTLRKVAGGLEDWLRIAVAKVRG